MPPEYDVQISVIGSGEATDAERQAAQAVGRGLARKNVTVVCGGGSGVMEAVAEGVQSQENGHIIGIRPEEHSGNANDYLDDVIVTGIGYARNLAVVLSGGAIIAIGGQFGTLSELAFAKKYNKPVFGIGTWDHEDLDFLSDLNPEDAVTKALTAAESL